MLDVKGKISGKKANMQITSIVIGVGVAVISIVLIGVLAGKTYQTVETDIDAITNTTIKNHIKDAVVGGFNGLKQAGTLMPIVVIGLIVIALLGLLLGIVSITGRAGGGAL